MQPKERTPSSLSALQGLLASARGLIDQMVDDPFAERLSRVLGMIPEAHREAILGVVERDATWCKIIAETSGATGINVHPNPHASLYVHVLDDPGPSELSVIARVAEPLCTPVGAVLEGLRLRFEFAPSQGAFADRIETDYPGIRRDVASQPRRSRFGCLVLLVGLGAAASAATGLID